VYDRSKSKAHFEAMTFYYERQARKAWNDCCKYDGIDPKDLVIRFSPDNPHRKIYDEIIQKARGSGILLDLRF